MSLRVFPGKKTVFVLFAALAIALPAFRAMAWEPLLGRVSAQPPGTVLIEEEPVPLAGTYVYTPQTGDLVYSAPSAAVDYSNVSEGYVLVRYTGSRGKIKVQITRSGSATYTYNLVTNGNYEVFPLTSGNGTYNIGVFENVSGNQYAQALSYNVNVQLRNANLPFLYPSQYVNFNARSATVAMGASLAGGAQSDLAIVEKVYNYVVGNITYDTYKAQTVQSGYLPSVDSILASGKGICFDYAAVMATMLRTQQIPTRLEVGYVGGGAYHAWISTYITDVGWVNGVIFFDGKSWRLMDPTFASGGVSAQYIGNGSNYRTQYIY